MTSTLFHRTKEIFVAASALPDEARAAFLDEQCRDDGALRSEVLSLLRFHDSQGPAWESSWAPAVGAEADSVGAYRLVEKLGEGGMGVVYEAEQTDPVRRRVALKLVKPGMDTREVLARFASERQALAMMDHPAIARVYEAGATDQGRPFFAMELVRGSAITEHCDRARLSIPERLRLFVGVCHGVQHAHQKGVIHRDLKPSNLIVSEQDGRIAAKIIDFGISRATEPGGAGRTTFTRAGEWIGTPEYMSPEQAEPGSLDVDTRSDVYSLGVVLYELLTGTVPFEVPPRIATSGDQVWRQIRDTVPPRPSTRVGMRGGAAGAEASRRRLDPRALARALRGDLDWIVMKAIDKDRARRYGSAAEMAADIERHLACEPVQAGPPSTAYRLGKLIQRHRFGMGAAAVVVLALGVGFAGTVVGLRRAEREAQAAVRATEVLAGVFQSLDPTGTSGVGGSADSLLTRGEEVVAHDLANRPVLQARVLSALGQARYGLGHYDKALPLLDRALALMRSDPQRDVSTIVTSLATAGWAENWSGRYERAGERFEEGLREIDAAGPAFAGQRVGAHFGLAWLAWRSGDLDRAQQHVDAAGRLIATSVRPDSSPVADHLFMAGLIRRERREFDAALGLLERCLAIRTRVFGQEHSSVAWALENLGWTELRLGRIELARQHMTRAIEIQERLLGPYHQWVAHPVQGLGAVELEAGHLAAARQQFERTLKIRRHGLGPNHPDLVETFTFLATVNLRAGDRESARQHLERALRIADATLPPGHPHQTRVLVRLEREARESGRQRDARDYAARLEALVARPETVRHPAHARDVYNLACIAALHGERARALAFLSAAVAEGFIDPIVLDDPDLKSLSGRELDAIRADVRKRLDTAAPRR